MPQLTKPTPKYYLRHKSRLAEETNRLLELRLSLQRTLLTTECTLFAVLAAFPPEESLPIGTRRVYLLVLGLLLLGILTILLSLYGRIVLGERFVADYHDRIETALAKGERVGNVCGYTPTFARLSAWTSVGLFVLSLGILVWYTYLAVIVGA